MSQLTKLPAETLDEIFSCIEPKDRLMLAACCKLLRQWRKIAWKQIHVHVKSPDMYAVVLDLLCHALENDKQLMNDVHEFYVHPIDKPRLVHQLASHAQKVQTARKIDISLGRTLLLCDHLQKLVCNLDPDATLEHHGAALRTIASLKTVREICLGGISCNANANTSIARFPKDLPALEHLTVMTPDVIFNLTPLLASGIRLKSLHYRCDEYSIVLSSGLDLQPGLEELALDAFGSENEFEAELETALAKGALKALHTLSLESYTGTGTTTWLQGLRCHNIPVTAFRFIVDETSEEVSTTADREIQIFRTIFESLPLLEILCVDQLDDGDFGYSATNYPYGYRWRSDWADIIKAFSNAENLDTLIVPAFSFMDDLPDSSSEESGSDDDTSSEQPSPREQQGTEGSVGSEAMTGDNLAADSNTITNNPVAADDRCSDEQAEKNGRSDKNGRDKSPQPEAIDPAIAALPEETRIQRVLRIIQEDMLVRKIKALMMVCPTLLLVICTHTHDHSSLFFQRTSAPVYDSVEDIDDDYRFWLSEAEVEVNFGSTHEWWACSMPIERKELISIDVD